MRDPVEPRPAAASRKAGGDTARDQRLKAALKANMARRKAQAKARAASDGDAGADNDNKDG